MHLNLSADDVLTTTRAVRKRLDLEKPVDPALVRECREIALQGQTGGNTQGWHFVAVYDANQRAPLAELYRQGWACWSRAFRKHVLTPGPSIHHVVAGTGHTGYAAGEPFDTSVCRIGSHCHRADRRRFAEARFAVDLPENA